MRGAATTFSSMTQQLSVLLAVAMAALMIRFSVFVKIGTPDAATQLPGFQTALAIMGGIGVLTSLRFLTLPCSAGIEVFGAESALAPKPKRAI